MWSVKIREKFSKMSNSQLLLAHLKNNSVYCFLQHLLQQILISVINYHIRGFV